jgi:hypothetical protein
MENLTWKGKTLFIKCMCIRTIQIKCEEGYTTFYLDKAWLDTDYTTSHQCIGSNE